MLRFHLLSTPFSQYAKRTLECKPSKFEYPMDELLDFVTTIRCKNADRFPLKVNASSDGTIDDSVRYIVFLSEEQLESFKKEVDNGSYDVLLLQCCFMRHMEEKYLKHMGRSFNYVAGMTFAQAVTERVRALGEHACDRFCWDTTIFGPLPASTGPSGLQFFYHCHANNVNEQEIANKAQTLSTGSTSVASNKELNEKQGLPSVGKQSANTATAKGTALGSEASVVHKVRGFGGASPPSTTPTKREDFIDHFTPEKLIQHMNRVSVEKSLKKGKETSPGNTIIGGVIIGGNSQKSVARSCPPLTSQKKVMSPSEQIPTKICSPHLWERARLLSKFYLPPSSVITDEHLALFDKYDCVKSHDTMVIHPLVLRLQRNLTGKKYGELAIEWYMRNKTFGTPPVFVDSDLEQYVRRLRPDILRALYVAVEFYTTSVCGNCSLCSDKNSHKSEDCVRYLSLEARIQQLGSACVSCAKLNCTLGKALHPANIVEACMKCGHFLNPKKHFHKSWLCNDTVFWNKLKEKFRGICCLADATKTYNNQELSELYSNNDTAGVLSAMLSANKQ